VIADPDADFVELLLQRPLAHNIDDAANIDLPVEH
jgi:hypothetical protein